MHDWATEENSFDSSRHSQESHIKVLASVKREGAASLAELIPQRAHAIVDDTKRPKESLRHDTVGSEAIQAPDQQSE